MYYRLGRGGRALWTMLVFALWCYVTWFAMGWILSNGMELGAELRLWLRSAGLAPIFADFFNLSAGFVGIFVVPISAAMAITYINKKLKGRPMKDNPYNVHLVNCHSCRENPLGVCEDADRSLRQAVEDGSASECDRELDQIRNGHQEE